MISIMSLLMVLTLSILVTRIATVSLTYNGLSRESAKFQARSAFTGVGFTTTESEKSGQSPHSTAHTAFAHAVGQCRCDNGGYLTIISFVNLKESDSVGQNIVLLVSGIALLWSVASSKWEDRHLSNLISRALKRYTGINVQDCAKLLHLAGDYKITELQMEYSDWLADKTLGELLDFNRRNLSFSVLIVRTVTLSSFRMGRREFFQEMF